MFCINCSLKTYCTLPTKYITAKSFAAQYEDVRECVDENANIAQCTIMCLNAAEPDGDAANVIQIYGIEITYHVFGGAGCDSRTATKDSNFFLSI